MMSQEPAAKQPPVLNEPIVQDNPLARFFGGNPTSVLIKLVIISVVVGALLSWVGLSPLNLFRGLEAMIRGLIGTGWDAVRNIGEYALYGAMVVVPIWLIARAMSARK
jgi:hypothetical protein